MKEDEKYSNLTLSLGKFADIGKYSTLLYGIANVVGDQPKIGRVIFAVLAYTICSFLGKASENFIIREIVSELETKLKE